MTIQKRIAVAVGRTRLIWVIIMIIALNVTLVWLPFWYIIFLIPFGIISYVLLVLMTCLILRETITSKDIRTDKQVQKLKVIHENLKSGKLKPGDDLLEMLHEADLVEISHVKRFSEEIFGHINGKPMYEWVEMIDPTTKKNERFIYFGVATYDSHGVPLLPDEKGKVYTHIEGVVYARNL